MANIKQIKIGNTLHEINAKYWNGKEASSKQDKLVSGSNIKTINDESLLGAGNIKIDGVYVWNIETLPIGDSATVQASVLKNVIVNYKQGKPIYIYDGVGTLPTFVEKHDNNYRIVPYTSQYDQGIYYTEGFYEFDENILNYNDDQYVDIVWGGMVAQIPIDLEPITSDELSLIFTEFDNVGSGYGLSGYGISESLIEETENE